MTDLEPLPEAPHGRRRRLEVEQLGDRIAELSARIQAATYQLLVIIRDFDEREGWGDGFASCAHWLNWRTGLSLGAAREKVRVARALGHLPLLSEAMSRGEISFSKVRALTRVATPANEDELLQFARCASAAHVERLVSAWRRVDRFEEAEREERRYLGRHLEAWFDDDGMLVVRGRLTPEVGAVFLKALEGAAERLWRESSDAGEEVTAGQRRADAAGVVAESALQAGLDPGTSGDRYQVVVHVGESVLDGPPEAAGESALEEGIGVSAETSRRIACDAGVVVMKHARDGTVLDVGRRTRTIPPAIRRALASRDRRCRFPGCQSRHCDAHHVTHWAEGGATKLGNLVLLCRRHHRAVHEGGFRVQLAADGEARFRRPDGRLLPKAPAPPRWHGKPLDPVVALLARSGVRIDSDTATPDWHGERLDVSWAVETLRRPRVAGPAGGTFPRKREYGGMVAD